MYRGVTEVAGSLEQALGHHLTTSTQVHAVLRLGCQIGADGEVRQAGGLLLERLPDEPGHPELSSDAFAERYAWVTDADLGHLLTQIAFGQLGGEKLDVLESHAITWRCRCSTERIEATLASLGKAALEEMIAEDHGAEITCNFCGTAYQVSEQRLRELSESR